MEVTAVGVKIAEIIEEPLTEFVEEKKEQV